MSPLVIGAVAVLFLLAAMLYSSVGHAGASGYIAVMALFAFAPAVMKPTALALNILVAIIATMKFYRAGRFSFELFWPFAVTSIPAAFIGGALTLPAKWYDAIVGVALLSAAVWMFRSAKTAAKVMVHPPPLAAALVSGLVIGLLSGLTGVGGGIFLSPLILMMGWAETRATSAVAAAFILVNSIAGLLGHLSSVTQLPPALPIWSVAVVAGGWIGAEYGSKRLATPVLRQLLSAVLVVAGLKMLFA
ncbi:MAG: sulfite exporter TauE/SafE family protein [Gemmatimonadaceae bacterium]|nr:sulfite exporter TauE/SafE family protein [Gemmatimonadaceae bacterium]